MTRRDRLIIVVVLAVGALAGAWLLVIAPKRSQAAKLGDQVHTVQARLDAVRTQVAQGLAAQSAFASNYAELVRLGEAVPADDNVPSLIYQIQAAANGTHVDFRDLQLTASSGSSGPPPSTTSSSATQASTATLPPGASIGPAGFPIEQFTFTFQGNFFHLADFFNRLQRFVVDGNGHVSVGGRLMSLNSITLVPSGSGFPAIGATVSATTYMLPASQGLVNGATLAGPAGASATPATGAAPTATTASTSPTPSTSPPAAVVAPAR